MQAAGELTAERFQDPETFRPLIAQGRQELKEDPDVPPLLRPVMLQILGLADEFIDSVKELEENEQPLKTNGTTIPLTFRPWEIKTLKIKLK